jgi:hypothetical protein
MRLCHCCFGLVFTLICDSCQNSHLFHSGEPFFSSAFSLFGSVYHRTGPVYRLNRSIYRLILSALRGLNSNSCLSGSSYFCSCLIWFSTSIDTKRQFSDFWIYLSVPAPLSSAGGQGQWERRGDVAVVTVKQIWSGLFMFPDVNYQSFARDCSFVFIMLRRD